MRIVAVENGTERVDELAEQLLLACPGARVERFTDPMLAVKACYERPAELAVAGYDLKRMDGIAFLKMLRQLVPGTRAVLIDEEGAHRRDAENLMFAYLSHPTTTDKLKEILSNL